MPVDAITIAKHFIRATNNILTTMAGLEPVVGKPFIKKDNPAQGDISAVIGVTGSNSGTISVSFSRPAAMKILHAMLGEDIQNLEKDMLDVVGEIANMVSGHARSSLASEGFNLQGSTPTIIIGDGHILHHQASDKPVAIPFSLDGDNFIIEFCFKE